VEGNASCRSRSFPILDISIRSGDKPIRGQSGKASEVWPNSACFWPGKFLWGRPPNFRIVKLNMLRTICGKISRRSAEGPRRSRV